MLYLHCGWPRTSTTTLQNALFDHRAELAEVGIVYPETWLMKACPSHQRLYKLMTESRHSARPLVEFKEFLAAHADSDVILSAENITFQLLAAGEEEALLALLATAREVMPARCVWTVRQFDEVIRSLYLRRLAAGFDLPPPAQRFEEIRRLDGFFAAKGRIDDLLEGEVAYAKYDPGGSHNDELLRVFGVPEKAAGGIRERLTHGPRLNASLTHKQAATLIDLEAVAARAGVDFDRTALANAFYRGELQFEQDRRCELVDAEVRRALHERALAAAERQGFTAYVEFFGDARVPQDEPVQIGSGSLTAEDLELLRTRFTGGIVQLPLST